MSRVLIAVVAWWLIGCTEDECDPGPSMTRAEVMTADGPPVTVYSTPWTCEVWWDKRAYPWPERTEKKLVVVQAWNRESAAQEAHRIWCGPGKPAWADHCSVEPESCREGMLPDALCPEDAARDDSTCVGVCGELPTPGGPGEER